MHTPWGQSNHYKKVAEGITFYSTPSHGGIRVLKKQNEKIHPAWRRQDGWYEEDCDWAIVAFHFPEVGERERAIEILIDWLPDEYEEVVGCCLLPGASHVKDEKAFLEKHRNDWIVISASGDWHQNVPKGMVGCVASQGAQRNGSQKRFFLVPGKEYDERPSQGFVIDEAKHEERDWGTR